MKTSGFVSVAALIAFAGLASADAIQAGPGVGSVQGSNPFAGRAPVLWDNGDTDGSNGYSEAVSSVFGFSRSTLDDFVVSDPAGWCISDYHGLYLWFSGGVGLGSDVNLTFWHDNGAGGPSTSFGSTTNLTYSETPTGRTFFGRPEVLVEVDFEPFCLPQGTYWVEMQIVGTDNAFHMVRSAVTGGEAHVNYADFGGLAPGSAIFGAPADMAFQLTGEVAPAPSALALLGIVGLAGRRRR